MTQLRNELLEFAKRRHPLVGGLTDAMYRVWSAKVKRAAKQYQRLADRLLEWHGGGGTGLYSVGSYLFAGHDPHPDQVARAINELRTLKAYARFPQCVTAQDEAECNALADELESRFSCEVTA